MCVQQLAHYGLGFMSVAFHNPNTPGATVSGPLGNGRIALTNQRVLLLCNANYAATTLAGTNPNPNLNPNPNPNPNPNLGMRVACMD